MATKYNLNIIKGSRYLKSFIYQDSSKVPIDLTGLSARMHIRERDNSPDPAEMELTTVNGRITLGGVTGQIDIILGATDTDTITIANGVYDLELYDVGDPDIVDTILEGAVTISDAITR
jgi:hypothetical protein